MKPIFLAALAILVATSPAGAQTAGDFMANPAFQGPRPSQCRSTREMQHCAADDLRAADARMATRYAVRKARLPAVARQALLAEQRTWLAARDADCRARYGGSGGSLASLAVARCWVNVTDARARALSVRSPATGSTGGTPPAAAFLGRWSAGEGTYMKISRRGGGFVIDNQWGLDADMHGVFPATLTNAGLRFNRQGSTYVIRPSRGDAINRSALRGKTDCLIVSREEGYCRY